MIVVAGTMRSGTSMWMQVLKAAGLPLIGDAFPAPWGERLREANPRGFFESQFLAGVYYATNPHPETGAYLYPERTRRHVVKVFVPGLLRTDVAFLDNVIATVRPWREYVTSMERMRGLSGEDREASAFDVPESAALRWWVQTFALIRDIAIRGYSAHVTTYDRMLRDPKREVRLVLKWLGDGNARAAAAAVDSALRTQNRREVPNAVGRELDARHLELFDELYDALDRGRDLSQSLIDRLNATDGELQPHIEAARNQTRERLLTDLTKRHADGRTA